MVHLAYYSAYAYPEKVNEQIRWRLTGTVDPERALQVFDLLATREKWDSPKNDTEEVYFSLVEPLTDLNIGKGNTKAMQGREGWTAHYRNMLSRALETPLPNVVDIEREVHYTMGGVDMLGYIDLVLEGENGLVIVDLKTEYNTPSEAELWLNDQIARYYVAIPEASDFWYYHLRSGKRLSVPRNDDLIQFLNSTDRLVAEVITDSSIPDKIKFMPRFSSNCAYCYYKRLCFGGDNDSTGISDQPESDD